MCIFRNRLICISFQKMKDEVALRKLQADGDGAGEEKRIQILINSVKEIVAAGDEQKLEECVKALKQIDSIELTAIKIMHVTSRILAEIEELKKTSEEVKQSIEQSRTKMEESKKRLQEVRIIRRNKQEYSQLVNVIEENPSRVETNRRIHELQDELVQLQERQKQLEQKLSERRAQLQSFNAVLMVFQKFITGRFQNNFNCEHAFYDSTCSLF
ncbi:hypothetical protein WR25_14622 isoform B [Diploscapter pachys]|uniref:Uncharacterized protein n=1 Tax=Diploscapter pachys TaxID=2018661 RepID=A0A2A2LF07_9BILA|nr:hypothetical protein WR25_14622 isoform B [Diploscapter pachys]